MADTPTSAEDRALDALTRILDASISPDMQTAQQLILRRLALAGDLFPSRIPPPRNITEVGGYLNLISGDLVMRAQVLSSALGVAGPNPSPGFTPDLPGLYYASLPNDRPPGPSQPAMPVELQVRSDFAPAFTAARERLHRLGAQLPVLAAGRPLPAAGPGLAPPDDLLPFLGRVLDLVPGTALADPATDPLALGQEAGAGPQQLLARQLDPAAPDAGSVAAATWALWQCDASACTQADHTGAWIPLEPILNAAGWYLPAAVAAPTGPGASGGWQRWTNVTGLVPGASTVGDELRLLHGPGAIAASSLRERLDWAWTGTTFAPRT